MVAPVVESEQREHPATEQRYVSDVKADINREIELDELRKMRDSMQQTAQEMQTSVQSELNKTEADLNKAVDEAKEAIEDKKPAA